jgi:hypothetical protein
VGARGSRAMDLSLGLMLLRRLLTAERVVGVASEESSGIHGRDSSASESGVCDLLCDLEELEDDEVMGGSGLYPQHSLCLRRLCRCSISFSI